MDNKVIRNLTLIAVGVLTFTVVLNKIAKNAKIKNEKRLRFSPIEDIDEIEEMLDIYIYEEEEILPERKYITLR